MQVNLGGDSQCRLPMQGRRTLTCTNKCLPCSERSGDRGGRTGHSVGCGWYRFGGEATSAADGTALVLDLTVARSRVALNVLCEDGRVLGSTPRWYAPIDACEAANLKAPLLPLPAWLARAVQGPEMGVYGALVGFGAELVRRRRGSHGRLAVGVVDHVAPAVELAVLAPGGGALGRVKAEDTKGVQGR